MAHGLQYLHARGLAHGRLKCGNVLMNKAGVAKLSDVSLTRLLSHCKTVSADKAAGRAPSGAGGNFAADMSPPEASLRFDVITCIRCLQLCSVPTAKS